MNTVLEHQAKFLDLHCVVKAVTTTYTYQPLDKEGQKAIMEGNYPDNLNVFFHCVSQRKDVMHVGSSWIKDPKGPYIIFNLRESFE